ncbi:MAG: hypothetical protein ACOVKS_00625 [Aquimonas sp.]|jgi:hypothetical protein
MTSEKKQGALRGECWLCDVVLAPLCLLGSVLFHLAPPRSLTGSQRRLTLLFWSLPVGIALWAVLR